ncbi:hypothetical protein [Burkholderia cenocepacia]|uniref:hypothetical protein n=1 Tax=Burkholderia cenocepacia TaxID=95486 RepID=UPI002AB641BA|nr:hypothetical protein [Burkholderia cenocepacia]
MSTNEKPDSQHIIELSTVYFYEGTAPRVIALKDCGLPMKSPVPGAFSALYGYQSKQEGFMAARAYADKNRLQFTVIDLLVKLDQKQNPLMMKPQDLPQHDFITFQRLSRSMMDELQEILRRHLERKGIDTSLLDQSKPHVLLMQRPDLITSVIDEPGWEHMKVIAYPAKIPISEKPLNIGTVPFRNWASIQKATCRLNPNIQITLDPPDQHVKDAATSAPAPTDRHRGPRMK